VNFVDFYGFSFSSPLVYGILFFPIWHTLCLLGTGMNIGLYQAASALQANARWQEAIAQNLSASSNPGYKKHEISFASMQASKEQEFASKTKANVPTAVASVNFTQGALRPTGDKTDLAIEGPGFFQVQMPDGTVSFTRDGELHTNSQGQLCTKHGYTIIGESGPITLDRNSSAALNISSTGAVTQGTSSRGLLKVVNFDDLSRISPMGGGYFVANDPQLQSVDAKGASIRQGFLEGSNTSPLAEMANLITAMRMFEANQKIIQSQDERMGKAISELAGTS
jgi:flagellar basal body rod protein FlgG